METKEPLRILLLAAEVAPFAKVGGLADVAGSLPKALHQLGHDVRVAMPRYAQVALDQFDLRHTGLSVTVPLDERRETVRILAGAINSVPVYFMDHPGYFERENVYGYPDDLERFILFCRSALEACRALDWRPQIIHCNDWHTAVVPNWLKTIYADDPFYAGTAAVYTIHNLQYQGVFSSRALRVAGLEEFGLIHHPETPDLNEVVDFMARGILFADVVTTVSPRYAQEILTPQYGERLDPVLRDRQERLFGILNGIDYEVYNPATDPHVLHHYDADTLDERVKNKLALQRQIGLPEDPEAPLLGMVSRLADQKGFDILADVIDHILDLGVHFVLLGMGDPHYHQVFAQIAQQYPDRAVACLRFDLPLGQRIYAGADMFLMPSRFEPCGLGQMIAMRYGCVPVARATGGLADTIEDFDPRTGRGTGFLFGPYDRWALFAAVVRALEAYKNPDTWRSIQRQGMAKDFTWGASARRYVELYGKALELRRQARPDEGD